MRLGRLQPSSAKGALVRATSSSPAVLSTTSSVHFLMPGEELLHGESPFRGSHDHLLGLRFKDEN
jgi:hypothetical protein